ACGGEGQHACQHERREHQGRRKVLGAGRYGREAWGWNHGGPPAGVSRATQRLTPAFAPAPAASHPDARPPRGSGAGFLVWAPSGEVMNRVTSNWLARMDRGPALLHRQCGWGLRRASGRADPDRLHVDELADAELQELAPVAAALDAAEGQLRIGGCHAVDEDAARLQPPRLTL